jgi:hypothetical protein
MYQKSGSARTIAPRRIIVSIDKDPAVPMFRVADNNTEGESVSDRTVTDCAV